MQDVLFQPSQLKDTGKTGSIEKLKMATKNKGNPVATATNRYSNDSLDVSYQRWVNKQLDSR